MTGGRVLITTGGIVYEVEGYRVWDDASIDVTDLDVTMSVYRPVPNEYIPEHGQGCGQGRGCDHGMYAGCRQGSRCGGCDGKSLRRCCDRDRHDDARRASRALEGPGLC